jgi:S-adenosylmethionine:tRNA ribosyltransferase-isomerase
MLVLDRANSAWEDHTFRELPEVLRGHELLVVNNARVFPARLLGRRRGVKAQRIGRYNPARKEYLKSEIEVLLLRQRDENNWEVLVHPGRKIRTGEVLVFGDGELEAEVIGRGEYGERHLRFTPQRNFLEVVERLGHVPLPPYIRRPDDRADRERYQTIFAAVSGAVAAPTAGLHFTPQILSRLRSRGVQISEITLQVGLGTFQPIHTQRVEAHRMHAEPYEITPGTAAQIERARREGRPVLAVGTTVVRAVEAAAQRTGEVVPGSGEASLFIYPGYRFQVVNQMLTNFHLPRSTLLLMVCAFASRVLVLRAYQHAIEQGYRFYSYGDCMLIR